METSSGVFVRHGRSNSPLCHRTTLSDSFLAISIPTTAGSACLSVTNDSIETCLTSTVRYASLFIGDDLLHVALLEIESATLPLSRRPPPFFTIANSARKRSELNDSCRGSCYNQARTEWTSIAACHRRTETAGLPFGATIPATPAMTADAGKPPLKDFVVEVDDLGEVEI